MLRTPLVPIVLATIVLGGCGGGGTKEPPPGNGPAFSPVIANELRAIAPDCKLERTGATERRDCTGRYGTVQIATTGGRLTALVIAMPPKILPEAKGHIGSALLGTLGAKGVEQLIESMSKLEIGQQIELTIGTAHALVSAGGTQRIAPEYSVGLSWP